MADEDFEEEELNYRKICKDIIGILNKIKRDLWIFNKFKLPDYQKKDLIGIIGKLKKLNYSEYNNQTFVKLMDISCQVEDLLEKMGFILGDLIKNIDNLSKSDEKKICSYFKIEEITPEFKKLSNKFNSRLPQMLKLIKDIINRYLSYYKEE